MAKAVPAEEEVEKHRFELASDKKPIQCLRWGGEPPALIFTHGAGGGLDSDALCLFSAGFATVSPILCFQGNMNLKSRVKMFQTVTAEQPSPVSLGGRSMGARAAVMAATKETACLVLVSYPLHTDGEVRDQILLDIRPDLDVLFVSGDRDSMCEISRLQQVRERMRCKTWLVVVRDADHGMALKPKSATKQIMTLSGQIAAEWLTHRHEDQTECEILWDAEEEVIRKMGFQSPPRTKQATAHESNQTEDPSSSKKTKPPPDGDNFRVMRSSKRRKFNNA